ncbi:hypothetical protein [Teredinibacter purpureus]|uniref:hypothetical protein n=1 Tax=Teredinibacter purpureus TaxID=2731756 RepID=UPI0005F82E80|nr:hypothetical protein [Teredinibacter purpureus]
MEIYNTPESNVEIDKFQSAPSVFWKIFFWIHIVLILFVPFAFIESKELHYLDYIDAAIFLPIVAFCLYCYAYSKRPIGSKIYSVLFYSYFLWAIFYEGVAPYILEVPSYGEEAFIDLWVIIIPVFLIPTLFAQYMLTKPINA